VDPRIIDPKTGKPVRRMFKILDLAQVLMIKVKRVVPQPRR